jgi:hypothetical protein
MGSIGPAHDAFVEQVPVELGAEFGPVGCLDALFADGFGPPDRLRDHHGVGRRCASTLPAALGRRGRKSRLLEKWPSFDGWRSVCWCCGAACVTYGHGSGGWRGIEEWPSFDGWRSVCWCRGAVCVRAGCIGWPVCRVGIHGTPKSICRHEMRQIQLDAYVSNRGESVKSDPGMMSRPGL